LEAIMLTTGNQLRAARALVDMDQSTLASRAGVNINTIGAMEKRGAELLTSGLDKIRSVMNVLEAEGLEFLNHGQPGVRLKRRVPDQGKSPDELTSENDG
jgi:transcriptional regulator with XRE-family HTH domain